MDVFCIQHKVSCLWSRVYLEMQDYERTLPAEEALSVPTSCAQGQWLTNG